MRGVGWFVGIQGIARRDGQSVRSFVAAPDRSAGPIRGAEELHGGNRDAAQARLEQSFRYREGQPASQEHGGTAHSVIDMAADRQRYFRHLSIPPNPPTLSPTCGRS